ncbi:CpaD family pilus assembly protein [Methylobacterium sp. NEAU 140]|uniref:CpaD family pilus assembly protein n=1 Tax=Methylobacterium sp. NEAU 140 TaxID=3064945 RepID=UPI002733D847|nr:CpaD family pilus assembly protein [Methylobacterium sp. NEAU 140]MDP4022787.1 CpaD family pilus assembly protein [Methylobacterium sp. NEAU 140]
MTGRTPPAPSPPPPRATARAAARAIPRLLAACAVAGLAAACKGDPPATGAIDTADYRARHPIVLADGTRSLDVFPAGPGHLDPRQAAEVDAFMLEYRRYGRGGVLMEVPRGLPPAQAAAAERTAALLARRGAEDGLPPGTIAPSAYAVAAPGLAAPIRLSFQRMQAKVDGCGLWPQDLGVSNFASDFSNRPYWNFGCAMQANVAAQVADPVDLVRGRTEGRIDTVRRIRDIGALRDGKDPSTTWRQDGQTSVKSQVAN